MSNKAVFLIGFMGTGKSVAGRRAALTLKMPFYDTDKLIEEALGMTPSQIFKEKGEEFFRVKEREMLEWVAKKAPCIISTGGGAPCYGDNLKFMKSCGITLTLLASPQTILQRVSASCVERPLLQCENPMEKIMLMLQKRAYYYISGDYLIDTDMLNADGVAAEIVKFTLKK